MNNKTFHKSEPVKEVPNLGKKKRVSFKTKVKLAAGITFMIFLVFFGLLLNEFIQTHTFKYQSPVVFQRPVIIKRIEIVSPMSSKSASLSTAYAAEVKNPFDERSPKGIAWELVKEKWGLQEWAAFDNLVTQESNWHPYSVNASSGACGIPQALPCGKMGAELWDYEGQLKWMISYISNRYNTPSQAWEHEVAQGWY